MGAQGASNSRWVGGEWSYPVEGLMVFFTHPSTPFRTNAAGCPEMLGPNLRPR